MGRNCVLIRFLVLSWGFSVTLISLLSHIKAIIIVVIAVVVVVHVSNSIIINAIVVEIVVISIMTT